MVWAILLMQSSHFFILKTYLFGRFSYSYYYDSVNTFKNGNTYNWESKILRPI